MTKQEQNELIGALASDLKEAIAIHNCLDLKARRIVEQLRIFCQALEAQERICTVGDRGIQLRQHPGEMMTILGELIEYPNLEGVLGTIHERDEARKRRDELQSQWNKVKP
ncbi:MAG: hypothetical protein F4Y91_17180 [Gemmatimonadetes bacterium]|nr:hypothetical protein [Gemmatimonadota bacterium]